MSAFDLEEVLAVVVPRSYHSNMRANETTMSELPLVASDENTGICYDVGMVARLRAALPAEESIEEARMLFAALADPTRIRILYAMRNGAELCVLAVADLLGISVSAASHHLRKLRDLRVLKHRGDGKMTYYSLQESLAAKLVMQALGQGE